jgi:hypothetical protein
MSQNEQQSHNYTDYEANQEKPGGYDNSSYHHPTSPTKQELKTPLLDKGMGSHQPPVYLPPGRSGGGDSAGSRVVAFIGTVGKLSVFHVFNAVLSIVGFVLISGGVDICIALIPLCCLGILLFPFVFFIVGVLAKLDVELYNFISPSSEHVYLDLPQHDRPLFGGEEGDTFLSPKVFSFSPQSIAAAVYFCTIKFVVGVLSSFVVTVNVWLLLAPVVQLTSKDTYAFEIDGQSIDARRNPLVFTVVWTSVLLLNVALMHLFAKLSRASTKFFCCEKLSTYRYVNAA